MNISSGITLHCAPVSILTSKQVLLLIVAGIIISVMELHLWVCELCELTSIASMNSSEISTGCTTASGSTEST